MQAPRATGPRRIFAGLSIGVAFVMLLTSCGSAPATPTASAPPTPVATIGSIVQPTATTAPATPVGATPTATAAPPPPPTQETVKRGGTLVRAKSGEPPSFDNNMAFNANTTGWMTPMAVWLLRYPLTDKNPYFVQEGYLAKTWEISDAGKTIRFNLNQGVKWHNIAPVNGRELTSEDVKFTIERVMDPENKSQGKSTMDNVDKVETPDKYTVVLRLKGPDVVILNDLGRAFMAITPLEAKTQYDPKTGAKAGKTYIGAGPYMMDAYTRNGDEMRLRNPDYFEAGLPYLDAIQTVYIKDAETTQAAFLAGKIHTAGTNTFDNLKFIRSRIPNVQMNQQVNGAQPIFGFNMTKPRMQDIRVRQAVAISLDRDRELKLFNGEGGGAWMGFVPPWLAPFNITEAELRAAWSFNPTKAKALLKEAGYPDGIEIEVFEKPVGDLYYQHMTLMMQDLAQGGITVKRRPAAEYAEFWGTVEGKNYGEAWYSGIPRFMDPNHYLLYYHPDSPTNFNSINDPKLKAMIDEQRVTLDFQKRVKLVRDAQFYIMEQSYSTASWHAYSYSLAQPEVKGFFDKIILYEDMKLWKLWIDK